MSNNPNPIPIILILLLLKNSSGSASGFHPPIINTLALESLLDNAHSLLHTIEKLNSFAQSGALSSLPSSLPDMKKMMEIVEKLPL